MNLMQSSTRQHEYFRNLDGLRFLGALAIILLHIEGIKKRHGRDLLPGIDDLFTNGNHIVSLFFVLSGFLITYLLLKEKQETGNINLKKFYVRRILKIWPLYILIGLLGFFVLPHLSQGFGILHGRYGNYVWLSCILYFLFLPPFATSEGIGAAWSVRVEEFFYLLWPLFLRRSQNFVKLCIAIVAIVVVARNSSYVLSEHVPGHWSHFLLMQMRDYRVSCMAIGGMGAYLYISGKQEILSVLYTKSVQWAVYILVFLMLTFTVNVPFLTFEVYAVLFSVIVLNLATNPQSIVKLEYKWMIYLGKISYGLYIYNPIMRILCLGGVERIFGREISGIGMNVLFYISTIGTTIIVSILSYELFEKRFLSLKKKFVS